MRVSKILFACISLALASCTTYWYHPTKTGSTFKEEEENCKQESARSNCRAYGPTAQTYCNKNALTGGVDCFTNSQPGGVNCQPNNDQVKSCLLSKGWTLQSRETATALAEQNKAKSEELKKFNESIQAKVVEMCNRDELREYYKKTACRAQEISFQHIADNTKITESQKTAVLLQSKENTVIQTDLKTLHKKRGDLGMKTVELATNFLDPENDKNRLDLYNGKITWGEYNKRRREIYAEFLERIRR